MSLSLAVAASTDPFAYVTNTGSNDVSVIDTASNKVTATIPVGIEPNSVTVNPAGTRIYVTNHTNPDVTVIDIQENQVIATIPFESYSSTGLSPGISVNPASTCAGVPGSYSRPQPATGAASKPGHGYAEHR